MCLQYMHHSYMPHFIPLQAWHMEVIHSHVLRVLTVWWFNISVKNRKAVIGKLGSMIKRKIRWDGERRMGRGKFESHTWDEGRRTTAETSSWRHDGEKEGEKNNINFSNVHCVSMHKCAIAMICEVGVCACVCVLEPSVSQPVTYPAVYQHLSSQITTNILQTTNHTQTHTCTSILKDTYWLCAFLRPWP